MAMILDAFLVNLSKLLTKMGEDEVGMLLGIPGEIEKLKVTVGDIQCVLSDAERKQTKGSAIERWLLQLKDVMYDADDLMDLCQIKADDRCARYEHLSSSKFSCGINLLSCFRNPIFAHKIGTKIKELNSRLDGIAKKKSDLGLIELQDVLGPSNVPHEKFDISNLTDPSVVLADIVGDKIEEDTKLLVKRLTTEEMGVKENVSVIAVVGMPGIGKTTLAKKVFNDPRIKEEFHLNLWVCVSKDLKGVELLKCIIREAKGNHGAAQERSELVPMVENLVRGKKFLLVLDDVWPESQNVWDGLLRGPMIGGARGSRILVTTRDGNVARFMNATTSHHVQKLSDEDSWSLLIKQVAIDQTQSKILNDVGLQLVKKCDGLPLAIKAIGGVLRRRDKNKAEWQKVLRSNLWSMVDLPSDFHRAFYLSYEDLPSYLKQCFIFCSLYPEDFEFDKDQLVFLWLAERFLYDEGDSSFLELGTEYYNELVLRNLLEVNEWPHIKRKCKMHDLMRSFALCLGKCENFIMREGELSHKSESLLKLRRLSIEGTVANREILNKEKSLRTLLLLNNSMDDFLSSAVLSFSHLRILDISNSGITSLCDSFCGLVHLRYLDAFRSMLVSLPNSIGNLRKLVYFNLRGCQQLSCVPSTIFDLVDLRYLSLFNTRVEVIPMGLRKLTKLVHLSCLMQKKISTNEFSSLKDLKALSQLAILRLQSMEKVSDINVAKEVNLKEKIHLKILAFYYNRESQEMTVAEDVLNALSPPPFVENLSIDGYLGHQLPNWLHMGTNPSHLEFLKYLYLEDCECFSQLPPLGQLPNLYFFKIEGATLVTKIGREFLMDDREDHIRKEVRQSSILPFSQLEKLFFVDLSNWEEWVWEKGQPAMPKLKKLFIEKCPELSSLPKGLSHHATSLEFLEIKGVKQIKYVEDLQSVKTVRVINNRNLDRISNLPNLSFIRITSCPNLKILENLKIFHIMELSDKKMESLPKYLLTTMPEKLTIWCRNELFLKIASQGVGSSEWQKFEHIPIVEIYSQDGYAVYQKTPFSFTTNADTVNQSN